MVLVPVLYSILSDAKVRLGMKDDVSIATEADGETAETGAPA